MKYLSQIVSFVVLSVLTAFYIGNHLIYTNNKELAQQTASMTQSRENSITTLEMIELAIGEYEHGGFEAEYVCLPQDSEITVREALYIVCQFYRQHTGNNIPEIYDIDNSFVIDDKYLAFGLNNGMIDLSTLHKPDNTVKWHHAVTIISNLLKREDMSNVDIRNINNLTTVCGVAESSYLSQKVLMLFNAGVLGDYEEYLNFNPYSNVTDRKLCEVIERLSNPDKRIRILFPSRHEDLRETQASKEKYILPLKAVLQIPELPTGCEATSLTAVLNYLGYNVDKCDVADIYLEKGDVGETDYRQAFIGNPRNESSFGCFSPVIVNCANKYLSQQDSYYRAYDASGQPLADLFGIVKEGTPVIVWTTINLVPSFVSHKWTLESGELLWYSNEHCVVLHGVDEENGVLYIADPLVGNVEYSVDLFEKRYNEMFMQAVVIK